MITATFKNLRNVSDIQIQAKNNDLNTEFGKLVVSKLEELKILLAAWDKSQAEASTPETPETSETPDDEKNPESSAQGQISEDAVKDLKKELEEGLQKTGGFQTSPPDSFPDNRTPDITGDGVKVTGGEHDPAQSQSQPGDKDHTVDPNEGQDPVDSNPPAKQDTRTPEDETTSLDTDTTGDGVKVTDNEIASSPEPAKSTPQVKRRGLKR